MPSLVALQDRMVAAILGGDMAHVAEEFRAAEADAGQRLNIYRNNTFLSLTEALKATFPVTVKLSDPRFFAYAAHEFIAENPPREARLSQFGGAFPRFLADFEPCRQFPVIAEMAALEWAIAQSLNGAEEPSIPVSAVASGLLGDGTCCLALQPNLRFVMSRWPLLGLWTDHQRENSVITTPLKPGVSRIAIVTHGDDIQCIELDAARFAFWRALARSRSIEQAAGLALRRDRLFDLVRETMLLFRSGLVTGLFTSIAKDHQS